MKRRLARRHTAAALCALVGLSLVGVSCRSPAPPSPWPTASPFPTTSLPEGPVHPESAGEAGDSPTASRYEIRIAVDPAAAQVSGHQEVRYTNAEDTSLNGLYLRLFPNTPGYGGRMTVTHLLLDGQPVTPTVELEGSALWVPLQPVLPPGQALGLSMDFTVTVPTSDPAGYAQLAYMQGVMSLPNVYPLIPVYDDQGWNVEVAPEYGDAVYSDVAYYTVQVTAPPTLTLIASGSCAGPSGAWTCTAAPMRDIMLVLGQEYQRASQVVGSVQINSYFYPQHRESGARALEVAADAVTVYSGLFGPYAYAELDVVETPTYAGGIEYPGLVVIGDRLYRGSSRLEWVVAHEVAHQWWYAVVGNDQVDEPWLDEALAQYSALLYDEMVYGAQTAADVLEQQFRATYERLVADYEDMPVGLPVAAYDSARYGAVVYYKGPLYFHALRQEVGDQAFFAILQTYYRRCRYGIATPQSFLTAIRIVTGEEHRDLFEQWIWGVSGQ